MEDIRENILVQAVVKKQVATGRNEERIWGLLKQIKTEHEDIINILTENLFGKVNLNPENDDYMVNSAVDYPYKKSENDIEVLVLKWEALLISTADMVEAIKEKSKIATYLLFKNSAGYHLSKEIHSEAIKVDVNTTKPLYVLTEVRNTDGCLSVEAVTQKNTDITFYLKKVMRELLQGKVDYFKVQCFTSFTDDTVDDVINCSFKCNGQSEFHHSGRSTDSEIFKTMTEWYLALCEMLTEKAIQRLAAIAAMSTHINFCKGLYNDWRYIYNGGASNPWETDGIVLNKIRNRIIYHREEINKSCSEFGIDLPEVCNREIPEEVDPKYMANKEEIFKKAKDLLDRIESNESYKKLLRFDTVLDDVQKIRCKFVFVNQMKALKRAIEDKNYIAMRYELQFYTDIEAFLKGMEECLKRISAEVKV